MIKDSAPNRKKSKAKIVKYPDVYKRAEIGHQVR